MVNLLYFDSWGNERDIFKQADIDNLSEFSFDKDNTMWLFKYL